MPKNFLQSPGVQIAEIDQTLGPVVPTGTYVLTFGFSPQGPTDSVIQVATFSEFETIYGKPTNAAERYFYNSVKQIFNSPASVVVGRLPYGTGLGSGFGNNYSALVYPVIPVSPSLSSVGLSAGYLSACSLSATTQGYIIGAPTQVILNSADYNNARNGSITWSDNVNLNSTYTNGISTFGNAGIVVLNTSRTTINEIYEGYYLGIADTSYTNPATPYNALLSVNTVNAATNTTYLTVPTNRLDFVLSAAYTGPYGSISQSLETITKFDVGNTNFVDSLLVGVYKLGRSPFTPNAITLGYNLVEAYTGSLDITRKIQNQNGGQPQSFFLGTVEDNSPNIQILINPSISLQNGSWLGLNGNPTKRVETFKSTGTLNPSIQWATQSVLLPMDQLFPLGSYASSNSTSLAIGAVPGKIDRLLQLVGNDEIVPLDITCEAGLGTIYVMSRNCPALSAANNFDDTQSLNLSGANGGFYKLSQYLTDANANAIASDYLAVENEFINFAEQTRRDHLFISDPLRNIFVQGANNKVLSQISNTFSIYTYWPLKHLYETVNSSYGTAYGEWFQVYDSNSDSQFWCPGSGNIASIYVNTDAIFQPWFAPAGFQRGVVKNVSDVAITPSQTQRDMLYSISVNPIAQFPNEGIIVMGQKTLLKYPSAFDRVNVRRLFLFLEKATKNTIKYFLFEPNTIITRNRIINTLTPIYEQAKATEGLYDYLIICDERNNTPDIIDLNELVVDIYLKPVRAAEFILCNFHASSTGFNFSEITG